MGDGLPRRAAVVTVIGGALAGAAPAAAYIGPGVSSGQTIAAIAVAVLVLAPLGVIVYLPIRALRRRRRDG